MGSRTSLRNLQHWRRLLAVTTFSRWPQKALFTFALTGVPIVLVRFFSPHGYEGTFSKWIPHYFMWLLIAIGYIQGLSGWWIGVPNIPHLPIERRDYLVSRFAVIFSSFLLWYIPPFVFFAWWGLSSPLTATWLLLIGLETAFLLWTLGLLIGPPGNPLAMVFMLILAPVVGWATQSFTEWTLVWVMSSMLVISDGLIILSLWIANRIMELVLIRDDCSSPSIWFRVQRWFDAYQLKQDRCEDRGYSARHPFVTSFLYFIPFSLGSGLAIWLSVPLAEAGFLMSVKEDPLRLVGYVLSSVFWFVALACWGDTANKLAHILGLWRVLPITYRRATWTFAPYCMALGSVIWVTYAIFRWNVFLSTVQFAHCAFVLWMGFVIASSLLMWVAILPNSRGVSAGIGRSNRSNSLIAESMLIQICWMGVFFAVALEVMAVLPFVFDRNSKPGGYALVYMMLSAPVNYLIGAWAWKKKVALRVSVRSRA